MNWDKFRAQQRIRKLLQSVPQSNISIDTFDENYFGRRRQERAYAQEQGTSPGQPILDLPYNRAVLTDGAHVYANLMNFGDILVYEDDETEASHRLALQFLHLHYAVCDELVRQFDVQRVDYHGGRMHAVVLTPVGPEKSRQRAIRAMAFAEALQRLTRIVSTQLSDGRLDATLRIGIDNGPAVGINSGRGQESDPLFLGNPANYAAKLAAGTVPGIFVSDRMRDELGESQLGSLKRQRLAPIEDSVRATYFTEADAEGHFSNANREIFASRDLRAAIAPEAVFRFHEKVPPLRSIAFRELMPSNSIRMPMVSVFADLDGFTDYVRNSIRTSNIPEMVSRIHVTRGELTRVLRDDFGGKKVRFVGDGLHGILATGGNDGIDPERSIELAVKCSAAMRSSLALCDEILGPSSLGIAIGMEFGTMPVSRIGHRGQMSVRCATGRASESGEVEQQRCLGHETALGERAYAVASGRVRSTFASGRVAENLFYEDALTLLDDTPQRAVPVATPRRREPRIRAHLKG